MADIDKFIKLLAQTDGRDKIYKTLQGIVKILGYQSAGDKELAKKYAGLAKSIGEGRSIMRMTKWVGNVNKLQGFVPKLGGLNAKMAIEILRVLGDFGYILGDNLAYLSKYKVLSLDATEVGKKSKIFQFWGYICAVILDILALMKNEKLKESDAATYAKERQAGLLNITKNLADTLATMAAVGYLSTVWGPSAGMTGALGATSGAIATYQNWTKTK
jgi:hypothetical protein